MTKKKSIQEILNEQKQTSKIYELGESRINYYVANGEKWNDPDFREKMRVAQSSEEYKNKISSTSKERWENDEYRERLSDVHKDTWKNNTERKQQVTEQFSKPKTETHKKQMSKSAKDFYQTAEGKKKLQYMRDLQKGKKRPKIKCPHCSTEGGAGVMNRWHFDNCKEKK